MKESLVTKIILDEHKVAIGVNVQSKEQKITVKANKEVILSAGAINSPQLLMLSGIGPKDELRKANIKLVADLPVGEKLQSHTAIVLVIKMEKSTSKLRSFSPYDYPFAATAGFVSINASQTYPDYQVVLLSSNADGVLSFLSDTQMFHNDIGEHFYQETKDSDAILITLYNSDPKSRGHITLRSSNPEDSPFVYINPFPDDDDLRKHIRYVEDMARLVDTTYFKSVGAELVHLPQCGDPAKGRDENYWKCYLQCLSTTAFHYVGTCPMTAVVDSRLRVYDVRNLRVVDASIMPTITSGNTMVPAIMIGEKAADMIKEDNCRR